MIEPMAEIKETWKSFATDHYRRMKASNPSATFKEALKAAAPLYREQKNNLYAVRGQVVEEHRQATGPQRAKKQAKADRIEAVRYGSVLRDMSFDYDELW